LINSNLKCHFLKGIYKFLKIRIKKKEGSWDDASRTSKIAEKALKRPTCNIIKEVF
jgi:hypothetical protein